MRLFLREREEKKSISEKTQKKELILQLMSTFSQEVNISENLSLLFTSFVSRVQNDVKILLNIFQTFHLHAP